MNEINLLKNNSIKFALWIQDNYSQNRFQEDHKIMLPKGNMRKDFSDEIYTLEELWEEYVSK